LTPGTAHISSRAFAGLNGSIPYRKADSFGGVKLETANQTRFSTLVKSINSTSGYPVTVKRIHPRAEIVLDGTR